MARAILTLSLAFLAASAAALAAPAAALAAPAGVSEDGGAIEATAAAEPEEASGDSAGAREKAVLVFLESHNLLAGTILLLTGLVPLFFGWRLIRFLYFVMGAVLGGGLIFAFTVSASLAPVLVVLLTINGALLWGFVMSYLHHVQVALSGGLFVAAVFAAPGVAMGAPAMGAGMGVLGLAVGLILGWCLAPLLGILQTALFGAVLMGAGAYVLLMNVSPDAGLLVGGTVALVGLVAGIVYQIRSGGPSPKAKTAARPRCTRRATQTRLPRLRPRLAPSAGKSDAPGAPGAPGTDTEVPR